MNGMPGGVGAERVDVAAERIGGQTLIDRRLRDGVVEAAAAVADVEQHAAPLGLEAAGRTLPSGTTLLPAPL